ncbi:MAG: PrsW family intramembrane metalloprotease [Chitinophagaceae bacterium]|nr:PrsW family intramembrane metalloprotease [Chitinophagaceae bacterium]
MGLLALAIAPGLAICLFILYKDKYNREPIWMLILAFVLGVLSVIPAILIQLGYGADLATIQNEGTMSVAFFSFCVVAASEEASKFIMLRLFLYPRKHFDDPFDGIVYAVMVGMGFATLENIGYVYEHGVGTGILRMFLAVPAHGTFAVMMGYFTGFAKFRNSGKMGYFLLALLVPIILHGSYDFFLFIGSDSLLALGALVSFGIALYVSFRAIRNKQKISRLYHEQQAAESL